MLKKKLPNDFLSGVTCAITGIGDTSYPKSAAISSPLNAMLKVSRFNFAARKLEKRLKQLGAAELVEACEADEQSDEG